VNSLDVDSEHAEPGAERPDRLTDTLDAVQLGIAVLKEAKAYQK